MTPPSKNDFRTALRLPADLAERATAAADAELLSLSAWIRRAILREVEAFEQSEARRRLDSE